MTNLDSIFKSRDITLPTKVHLVKAMVFLVVMYGCESWAVKKAEHRSKMMGDIHPCTLSFAWLRLSVSARPHTTRPVCEGKIGLPRANPRGRLRSPS